MPDVVEIEGSIGLLSRRERRDNGLSKKVIFKIAEVVGVP